MLSILPHTHYGLWNACIGPSIVSTIPHRSIGWIIIVIIEIVLCLVVVSECCGEWQQLHI